MAYHDADGSGARQRGGHGGRMEIGRTLMRVQTKDAAPTEPSSSHGRTIRRRGGQQQRAIKTRIALLEAALSEFAQHGFEGASIRGIGQRAGLEYTLIKYHFSDKETLWKSTAAFAFEKIYALWEEAIPSDSEISAAERVDIEFHTLLRFTVHYPDFHQFMLRDSNMSSPRNDWLVTEMLKPTRDRVLPQIVAAQQAGEIIDGDPAQVYHMLIGMATALSSQQGEMMHFGFRLDDTAAVESYWELVKRAVFPTDQKARQPRRSRQKASVQ